MSFKFISELSPPGQNQAMKIRVARFWDCTIPTTGKSLGIAFVATDAKGEAIHVQIKESNAEKFKALLIEGAMYKISRFQVIKATMRNLAVDRELAIVLNKLTEMKPIQDNPSMCPRHFFNFQNTEVLSQMANSDKKLADTIGVLISIGPIMPVRLTRNERTVLKRDLWIRNHSGTALRITIWEPCLEQINEDDLLQIKPKPVIIFAGMVVKTYQGSVYLSSCSATKVYINLDIPQAEEFIEMPAAEEENVALLGPNDNNIQPQPLNVEPLKVTIKQLLSFNPEEIKQTLFKTTITIQDIETSDGWFYYACNECQRGLNQFFSCTTHGPKTPRMTMRLPLLIKDETGEMDITAFDRHAEDMTGMSISTMSATEDISKNDIPAKVTELIGRKYQLIVALPKKAVEKGDLTYRITGTKRIFSEEGTPKCQSATDKESQCESHTEINLEEPLAKKAKAKK